MLTDWPNNRTVLNRVVIRGKVLDSGLAGPRLNHLLNHSGLPPAGLAASAILCINSLRDPLPGLLRLEKAGELLPVAWEKALATRLSQLAQQAARPVYGPVPAGAEAVIFDSPAELLACLAVDWCNGQLRSHWWWQGLPGKLTAGDLNVIQKWQDTPEFVPLALQLLTAQGNLTGFIRRWEPAPAGLLLARLVECFGLGALVTILAGTDLNPKFTAIPANVSWLSHEDYTLLTARQNTSSNLEFLQEIENTPPWQAFVPERLGSGATLAQAGLVGVGLMLHRAPEKLRTHAFAHSFSAWLDFELKSHPATSELTPESKPTPTASDRPSFVTTAPPETSLDNPRPDRTTTPRPQMVFEAIMPPSESAVLLPRVPAQAVIKFGVAALPIGPQALPDVTAPVVNLDYDLPRFFMKDFASEFAGVVYLVNLGLFLELYGDFTQPARPGLDLSIWDFLALLGEGLAGKSLRRDALWQALAGLAGRTPQERPGRYFEPPDWRIPPTWLASFPEKNWNWETRAGRLHVNHPARFPVLDVALKPDMSAIQQLEQELQAYPAARLRRRPTVSTPEPPLESLERWLGCLLPYVKARLGRAFGLTPSRAGRLLCHQPGRIRFDESYLEIHFSLDRLPLEIRLAGLDRDPGWVPSAGRYVSFIFD